ncbi:MAG: ABC transporter permease subunit, partial [Verrucomicrobiia bacterium]
ARFDLSEDAPEEVDFLLVNRMADLIVAASRSGIVKLFARTQRDIELRQTFRPFEDEADARLAKVEFLFGDASLVLASESGANRIFSLHEREGDTVRRFHHTKTFPGLASAPTFFAKSLRNKAFLIGNDSKASLRFSTTESVRWEGPIPSAPTLALLGPKYDLALFLTPDNRLERLSIDDKHPEAGWRSFFGKVWYEGSNRPDFVWQSTGGSDDFEPKLSLIPLIFGTLKGTLYAMIFALPIALLSALYVSQFAHPDVRRVVKPTMEIMASLPSVVLGFLAALWLAPAIETRVPSILLIVLLVPASALAMGWMWQRLPARVRIWSQWGHEWWLFLPCLALVVAAGWMLGPLVEKLLFTVTDPSGLKIADFRRWWPEVTGTPFQQRNSLVVGFMMGFAVIPIIFTIAEDSLSNVPGALRSGSLALGASRWQTAINVVLPTASPGIFSAIMIGLGRAVGETMIVVMATGNTPIMELNIFSGMRTLSANIAVELPEAAEGGTLYRTLFLGAMVLFLLTFSINTIAEILRQWLRERYKLV